MGIIRIVIEQKAENKQIGIEFARDFLQRNNLIQAIRNFYVGDGSNVLIFWDESQEFQKAELEKTDES